MTDEPTTESLRAKQERGEEITMADVGIEHLKIRDDLLYQARTFLASIASAQSQGTQEQTDWMIAQAREGLRRCGGHDFDACGEIEPQQED